MFFVFQAITQLEALLLSQEAAKSRIELPLKTKQIDTEAIVKGEFQKSQYLFFVATL